MHASQPHFLLFSQAIASRDSASHWQFILQPVGGEPSLAAADEESAARPGRLELLAVVRGLEALDQPSRVTLVTASRYVTRGIRRGLSQWRERCFRWERFGQLVPIRDSDLWQRVDRALQIHQVECCDRRVGQIEGTKWSMNLSTADFGELSRVGAVSPLEKTGSPLEMVPIVDEPALVIVPRAAGRRVTRPTATTWPLGAALNRLRQAVLTHLAALRGPAFTRAA
jgi:ribonuclease HI